MTVAAERPTADDRIRAALWFAEHGFGVFSVWSTRSDGSCRCPLGSECTSPGKHPVTPNGFHDATTDTARIRTLLSAGSGPNYGLVPPDGVFAWDVDTDAERQRLSDLETRLGDLPATLRTNTAHGQHVFLRWPSDRPRPLRKMFGYVTRWGTGAQAGYVIGPRSVHASGAVYTPVAGTLEIAEIPDAWTEAALAGEATKPVVLGEPLPEAGQRHDWLRDRARYLRGMGLTPDVLRAALLAENARLPQPKTAGEVERAIGKVFELFPEDPPEEAEDKVARRLNDDELGLLSRPASLDFPADPDPVAFAGLLGELVEDLAPGTDASLTGLLGSLLAFCGALVPGEGFYGRAHRSMPFVALVGESSVGRKGTAMNRVRDAFSETLEAAAVNRIVIDGVNSGEALVSELNRATEYRDRTREPAVRLLFEEEYATLLASRQREGSNLDPKMRAAFDGGQLSNLRSDTWKVVQPPYWLPALIAITPTELRARLESHAVQSGSANRWLYLPVTKRDRGGNTQPMFEQEHRDALQKAHHAAMKQTARLDNGPTVEGTLREYDDFLASVGVGLARDLTRRFTAIAFRVALIHALVERSRVVTADHLMRALALTEYARRGIAWVFGETVGNPDADLLFRHLQADGRLSRRAITQQIIRDPIRRQGAIDELLRLGRARIATVHTAGRPRTELIAVPDVGSFVRFVQGSATPPPGNTENVHEMHQSPELNVNDDAQKVHGSRTELHGTAQKTGITCAFYAEHQTQHFWSGTGWVCPICEPPT